MGAVSSPEFSRNKIHPHKFALWVGIASIMMMFGAFTSAYVVRRSAGNWLEFKLPDIFFFNTVVIILSSVTLHYAYRSFKKGNEKLFKALLLTTFVLGISFVILQYKGWEALNTIGATFTINPSSSFIYVISGLHAAHVLGGVAALLVALAHAFILPFKPTVRRRQRLELVVQYWHFVDVLWVYLIMFFMVQS
ncbi:MAG: cytochrome c oxidase subunit 3 [Saprospiraceae bacterium]|nr:cytochrome c oxidase subunit 3 [Saprospiraceae bacterium]MCB0575138.1 cytochrome c oxidase subunit 3 [Saprospiraceae bacterium]MCB9307887.1 cytochrome c oxidase subunit 3 [Lewinellaceae bacterium]MCB9356347.1 cytochrome c oxidase subunit 3 [Lewinellaceae bacterium]